MSLKHFTQTSDLGKENIITILDYAKKFQEHPERYTDLCRGKVMGVAFFQDSLRTIAAFQAAMIRLGGGWVGFSASQATYVLQKEEDEEDTLRGLGLTTDIMAVRHKSFDLPGYAKKSQVPLINAMCGGEEHASGALAILYTAKSMLDKIGKQLAGAKIGVYGMTKSSRPTKALLRLVSHFNVTIYEDAVIPEFATPAHIAEEVKQHGSELLPGRVDDFIKEVDYLWVVEGLPQAGEDENLVRSFNTKFRSLNKAMLTGLKSDSVFQYCEPRAMTDGRLVAEKEVDDDARCGNNRLMIDFPFVAMGLIAYLLDLKV